jgi:hypothetical protein
MSAMSRNIRQWWLPSLLLLLAIILASLLLPNLIYPRNVQEGIQPPGIAPETRTPTSPAATVNSVIVRATTNVRLETLSTPNIELRPGQNCTYTFYYWRSNPDAWLAENILIGRFSYSKSEAIEILQAENQEVTTDLLKQFFAALLNSLKGADTSSVDVTLVEASDWLGRHALGFEVSDADRLTGAAIAQTLDGFNSGATGPGLCADEPPTPTPGQTDTPTPTETPTATPVPTRLVFTAIPNPPTSTPEKDDPPDGPPPSSEEPTEPPSTEPPPTEPPPTEPPPTVSPPTEPPATDPPPPPTDEPEPTERPTPSPVPEPVDGDFVLPLGG